MEDLKEMLATLSADDDLRQQVIELLAKDFSAELLSRPLTTNNDSLDTSTDAIIESCSCTNLQTPTLTRVSSK